MEELLILHPNFDVNPAKDDQTDQWESMAFSVAVSEHKVIHKIGLELNNGGNAFIGDFAIYKISNESS